MRFALTTPGPEGRFWCEWPGVSIGCADGRWRIETDVEEGFDDLRTALGLVARSDSTWTSGCGSIRVERLEDVEPEYRADELDELVELEFEIGLEPGTLLAERHLCCGGCHLDTDAFGGALVVTVPLSRADCERAPFTIRPVNAEQDAVVLDERVIGCIWKAPDERSPYGQLDGMVNTVAHPYFFHPVWPTLSAGGTSVTSVVEETVGVETWEDLEEEYQSDYLGINDGDLGVVLAGLAHALEDVCAEEYADELEEMWGDEGDVEIEVADEGGELEHAQHLLASCLFSGSRAARTVLAKRGIDTDISRALGREGCSLLVEGALASRSAFRRISGDERFSGVYSFDVGTNRRLEALLGTMIDEAGWERLDADALWGWACWAFDLGARYQTSRVGSAGLDEWTTDPT